MDRGVGATPRTTGGRRASRTGVLDHPRLLVVAAVLSTVVAAASPAVVRASADAGRAVRATAAEVRSWSCDDEGDSGGDSSPVSCEMPPPNEAYISCPAPLGEGCVVRLHVTVVAADRSKHDLGVSGQIFNHRFQTITWCDNAKRCDDTYFAKFRCGDITGDALGYAKGGLFGFLKVKIRVYGTLTFEGFAPYPEPARSAHAAAAGCGPPAPLEVAVNGVATDDPLTGEPLATGYGNVSISPPNAGPTP